MATYGSPNTKCVKITPTSPQGGSGMKGKGAGYGAGPCPEHLPKGKK
jgi:hypothetical protein